MSRNRFKLYTNDRLIGFLEFRCDDDDGPNMCYTPVFINQYGEEMFDFVPEGGRKLLIKEMPWYDLKDDGGYKIRNYGRKHDKKS